LCWEPGDADRYVVEAIGPGGESLGTWELGSLSALPAAVSFPVSDLGVAVWYDYASGEARGKALVFERAPNGGWASRLYGLEAPRRPCRCTVLGGGRYLLLDSLAVVEAYLYDLVGAAGLEGE